jgi:hypothetical protein
VEEAVGRPELWTDIEAGNREAFAELDGRDADQPGQAALLAIEPPIGL